MSGEEILMTLEKRSKEERAETRHGQSNYIARSLSDEGARITLNEGRAHFAEEKNHISTVEV
jgi:hypothetical protein